MPAGLKSECKDEEEDVKVKTMNGEGEAEQKAESFIEVLSRSGRG